MKRFQTAALFAALLLVAGLVGSMVAGLGSRGSAPAADVPAARARPEGRVRVEVLNAAGIPGLAREATRDLRRRGFDVVYFGNARGRSGEASVVIDRAGKLDVAREVGEALEVGAVRSQPDTTLYVEVTVVLGRDWKGAREARADSGAASEKP